VVFAVWVFVPDTLLANGSDDFTLHPDLNWHVLGAASALSLLTGLVFGLAPALQSTGKRISRAQANASRRSSSGMDSGASI
jgi:hypothetical protein